MESVKDVHESQLSGRFDQLVIRYSPCIVSSTDIQIFAGGRYCLLVAQFQVFTYVRREMDGDILQADERVSSVVPDLQQRFRHGELIRGRILPEQDDGTKIRFQRRLILCKKVHDSFLL